MARKMKGAVNNLKHDDLHKVANDRVSFQFWFKSKIYQDYGATEQNVFLMIKFETN